jgi:chromatin segregation and condensation protein Rec8/ScpA/Scc1 (kleisin family)
LFTELFEGVTSRSEIVVTFLALLELIRLKQLVCAQPAEFAEIEIRQAATFNPTAHVRTEEPAATPVPSLAAESALKS